MSDFLFRGRHDDDLDGDTLHEECGVFGILGHPDAATLATRVAKPARVFTVSNASLPLKDESDIRCPARASTASPHPPRPPWR